MHTCVSFFFTYVASASIKSRKHTKNCKNDPTLLYSNKQINKIKD